MTLLHLLAANHDIGCGILVHLDRDEVNAEAMPTFVLWASSCDSVGPGWELNQKLPV